MTTEDMIEAFIKAGVDAYKKLNKNSVEGRKLYRHEKVTIEGYEFTCWREYATYKMGEYIKDTLPDCNVEIVLDGNDSTLKIEVTDAEQEKLNRLMFLFLQEQGYL